MAPHEIGDSHGLAACGVLAPAAVSTGDDSSILPGTVRTGGEELGGSNLLGGALVDLASGSGKPLEMSEEDKERNHLEALRRVS